MTLKGDALPPTEGVRLRLRLITPDDADYVFGLRTDPAYNAYLSAVTGTAADQRAWIEGYKTREAAGREYYFIIERLDGRSCGVVRLYGVEGDQFTWGSWILDHNKPAKAALETAYLVYVVGFDRLGLQQARFDVRRDNERTLAFHRRFGATETGADDRDVFFVYPRERFEADRAGHMAVLQAEARP